MSYTNLSELAKTPYAALELEIFVSFKMWTASLYHRSKTHGKEVMASLRFNSKCEVCGVHSKRAWKDSYGASEEAFQESFRGFDQTKQTKRRQHIY